MKFRTKKPLDGGKRKSGRDEPMHSTFGGLLSPKGQNWNFLHPNLLGSAMLRHFMENSGQIAIKSRSDTN